MWLDSAGLARWTKMRFPRLRIRDRGTREPGVHLAQLKEGEASGHGNSCSFVERTLRRIRGSGRVDGATYSRASKYDLWDLEQCQSNSVPGLMDSAK